MLQIINIDRLGAKLSGVRMINPAGGCMHYVFAIGESIDMQKSNDL